MHVVPPGRIPPAETATGRPPLALAPRAGWVGLAEHAPRGCTAECRVCRHAAQRLNGCPSRLAGGIGVPDLVCPKILGMPACSSGPIPNPADGLFLRPEPGRPVTRGVARNCQDSELVTKTAPGNRETDIMHWNLARNVPHSIREQNPLSSSKSP
jgi:hypothetical protein